MKDEKHSDVIHTTVRKSLRPRTEPRYALHGTVGIYRELVGTCATLIGNPADGKIDMGYVFITYEN